MILNPLAILTSILLLQSLYLFAAEAIVDESSTVVEPCYVYNNLNKQSTVLIDLRNENAFKNGHIPNAINIPSSILNNPDNLYPGGLPTAIELEQLFRNKGVSQNAELVLYDNDQGANSARLWWVLQCYSYKNVRILKGGIQNWSKAYKLNTSAKKYPPSLFYFSGKIDKTYFTNLEEINKNLKNPKYKIIDVRSLNEFTGTTLKTGAQKNGRIPGSLHFDWQNFSSTHKNTDISKIKTALTTAGISPDDQLIIYSHAGTKSAHLTFILSQLLDYPNVKNYDGSWAEWSYYKALPIEKGPLENNAKKSTLYFEILLSTLFFSQLLLLIFFQQLKIDISTNPSTRMISPTIM